MMRDVRVFWKVCRRLLGVLLILLLLGSAYLHVYGFPPFLIRIVQAQLARTGLAARFAAIRLDLFRGVVATEAKLADINEPERTLIEIDEVQLHLNWRRLLDHKNVIDALRIANAVVAVPLPADERGREYFTARDAFATLLFEEDGTVRVDRLMGEYCGIRLFVRGRFKPKQVAGAPGEPPRASQFLFLTRVVRELNQIRVTTPPEMDLEFDVDMAHPLAAQAHLHLRGTAIEYRGLRVDGATVDVQMEDGAVRFRECVVALSGGEVRLTGRYDFARGQFELHASSTTDPTALAVFAPPDLAAVLHDVRVQQNPRLTVHYALSPETGSRPQLQGEVVTGGFSVRGVSFRAVQCRFQNQGPELVVEDGLIVTPEGRLTGRGRYNIESSDFAYQFDSTLNPTKLLPLMLPKMREIVEPAWFEKSPHIVASVVGDFVDPDNFGYDAVVTAGRCRYRGVDLDAASGTLFLRQSRLRTEDLRLQRPEGLASGRLFADFNEHQLTFDIHCTANPNALSPLVGPKGAAVLKPYRFGPRTDGHARGLLDFQHGANTAWTAAVTNEGFGCWKFNTTRAAANLTYTNNTLAIQNLEADFYDGKLSGDVGFSFAQPVATYQLAFQVDGADVQQMLNEMRGREQKVSGRLSSKFALSGQGSDLGTLHGEGGLEIKEGLLLEMPLFGIFSHILDEISPGLGQSKATNAKATFQVVDKEVRTDDLRISAGAFTLSGSGDVGLDGGLDFRMKAQILKQIPLLNIPGIILGKIFEYKIGGTLGNPNYRPVHFPKELLPHSTGTHAS